MLFFGFLLKSCKEIINFKEIYMSTAIPPVPELSTSYRTTVNVGCRGTNELKTQVTLATNVSYSFGSEHEDTREGGIFSLDNSSNETSTGAFAFSYFKDANSVHLSIAVDSAPDSEDSDTCHTFTKNFNKQLGSCLRFVPENLNVQVQGSERMPFVLLNGEQLKKASQYSTYDEAEFVPDTELPTSEQAAAYRKAMYAKMGVEGSDEETGGAECAAAEPLVAQAVGEKLPSGMQLKKVKED